MLNASQELEELKNNEAISKEEATQIRGETPMMLRLNQIHQEVNKTGELDAEYVTQKGAIFGKIRIMRDYFIFDSCPSGRPQNEKKYWFGVN